MAEATLLDLHYEELGRRLPDLPSYRVRQIWYGAYRDLATSYDDITTLPLDLRAELARRLPFPVLDLLEAATSERGDARKVLYRLADGETVESVEMIYPDRVTACVSSQVGCPIGCPFCATGQSGFVRDLAPGEIVAQVLRAAARVREVDRRLSHVVYMGMGEPLLNYDATMKSVRILNDKRGFALGARSFTISTAGIPPAIDRLAEEGLQVNLAISLHAADDPTRDRLVPVNRRYPVATVLAAARRYAARTHRRVTFEFALIDGANDSDRHADTAARLLSGILCHVNLIPYNDTPNATAKPSSPDRIQGFAERLEHHGIVVTIRRSMGTDIDAGCGQLRARRGAQAGLSGEESKESSARRRKPTP